MSNLRYRPVFARVGFAATILFGSYGSAQADWIVWNYEATINDVFGSPFGLHGETIGISVILDASGMWQDAPQYGPCCLVFPSVSSSAFITGPHSVALNGPFPAAWTDNFLGQGGFIESPNASSGFDFIIDGIQTLTLLSGPRAVAPSVGDNLLPGHLPSTLGNGFIIGIWDFLLDNPVVTVSSISPAPADFFTVDPCRVIDTRNADGPLGGPVLVAQAVRTFTIVGNCGIPMSATSISVNLAVTQPSVAGNIRLYPGGGTVPTISSINYVSGQTRSNNAIVGLNPLGQLSVFVGQASGSVHFILDVNGYFQ